MKPSILLSAAVISAIAQLSPAPAVTPAQSAPAASPTPVVAPAASAVPAALQFRALTAVLDARERQQNWHLAAQQAAALIQDSALREQFNQRLAGLAPSIAKALIAQPQEDALVTVAVYRDPAKADKPAIVAVTFDGLGAQVSRTFCADVIAGLPKPPEAEGIPKSLALDTDATSYLVFFLGRNELSAGDIPHSVMSKSVLVAINRQREHGDAGGGNVAVATPRVTAPAASTPAQQQADVAHPEVGTVAADNSSNVIPEGSTVVNDGYYYPSAGVPIVIVPGEYPSTPANLEAQRRRQMELEKRYQQNANSGGSGDVTAPPNSVTPQSTNFVTPQSGNSVSGGSGNSVSGGSGNSVRATSGNYVSGGSGNSVKATSGNYVGGGAGNSITGGSGNSVSGGSGNSVKGSSGSSVHNDSGNSVSPQKGGRPQAPVQTPPAGAPGGPPVKK